MLMLYRLVVLAWTGALYSSYESFPRRLAHRTSHPIDPTRRPTSFMVGYSSFARPPGRGAHSDRVERARAKPLARHTQWPQGRGKIRSRPAAYIAAGRIWTQSLAPWGLPAMHLSAIRSPPHALYIGRIYHTGRTRTCIQFSSCV
jgi:hypothetical protein